MTTECNQTQLEFQGLDGRRVVADFEAGDVTSDAGLLVLRELDIQLKLIERAAKAFSDKRRPERIEHTVEQLLRQRVVALAAGYEDLNDHDRLRQDPLLAVVVGKTDPTGGDRRQGRRKGKPCAGKSTLNRLELSPDLALPQAERYHRITCEGSVLDRLFVDTFVSSYGEIPTQIILDLDATDDPLHGNQEGRFFHGYYDCYCYMPLYIFCGDHLLCARLRRSNIDGCDGWDNEVPRIIEQIRSRWPKTRIILRADSGFCREPLMAWCEGNGVDYVFGLARNERLEKEISEQLAEAKAQFVSTRMVSRCWKDFVYRTRESWSCDRRVVGKAEWIEGGEQGKANPRFVVTSLSQREYTAQVLYENVYCQRGEMENRIKEQQLDLFADRTSTAFLASNQLRLYISSLAYVLINALRQRALAGTELAQATVGTIRRKLLKAGALIRVSVRRVLVSISSSWPSRDLFVEVVRKLRPQLR